MVHGLQGSPFCTVENMAAQSQALGLSVDHHYFQSRSTLLQSMVGAKETWISLKMICFNSVFKDCCSIGAAIQTVNVALLN